MLYSTSTFTLRLLCEYILSAILVHVKHWYSFKKISLPFSGLYSHTFRKLSESLNLSFSNLLSLYTHSILTNSTSDNRWPKIHHNCRTTGVRRGTQNMQHHLRPKRWASPSPNKCRVRCICTHHKVVTSASKIPQRSPRERKLFQEPIPLPFLKYLRTCNSSQGYPTGRGRCSRVAPLPALQPSFHEASEWSSNWTLTVFLKETVSHQ